MKLHLCCGTVYLENYMNCDHNGEAAESFVENPNKTTIDKYFKFPFVVDKSKRILRNFIVDQKMEILKPWIWENNSIEEIVLVNAIEHFEYPIQVSHIIDEAYRVLIKGGIFKFDFPDLKSIINLYHDTDPEFCVALIYGTHKDMYSRHEWGYTIESMKSIVKDKWEIEEKDVVKHDYPSTGIWLRKV